MPGEAEQDEVVVAATSVDESDTDLDFESGFEGKPTESAPPAEEKPVEEVPPKEEGEPAAAPAAEPKHKLVTDEEWNALMAKADAVDSLRLESRRELDRAFGKVGGLERKLAELQAATPAGQAIEVSDEDVADLAEFPELAGGVLKALRKVVGKMKGTAPVQATAPVDKEQFAAIAQQSAVALQLEALEDEHAGWRELVGAPGSQNPYRLWLAKQSAEYQERLNSTNNALVIARSITRFKETSAAEAKAAAEKKAAEDAAALKKGERQKVLAAAATPRGAGGHAPAPSPDDEFESGFKSG